MMESRGSRMESRRSLLKKIGAGGAMVWAAPIITSASPVGGQLSACPAVDWNCFNGDPLVFCTFPGPPIGICICDNDTEGNGFCLNDVFCSDVPTCVSSGDCPPGWRCVADTCCGVPICAPPCGTVPAVTTGGTKISGS